MIRISSKNNVDNGEFCESLFYQICIDEKNYDINLIANRKVLIENMESPLALALPAAMRLNLPIYIDGSVSRQYLEKIFDLMKYYEKHFDDFHKVSIKCKSILEYEFETKDRSGSFFSGGVDSFYTLLKRLDDIDALIVLYGFDIKLKDADKIDKTKQATRKVALSLNKEIIEIQGNFTGIITDYCEWVTEGHGFALAAASRALSGWLDTIYIPGTHTVKKQKNWGSSIYTDQQHSDNKISIVHDSDENERIEKLIFISENQLALENLRVCGDVPYDGNYNCSRCEKCIRTMLQLWSINKLDQSKSFHLPLTPQVIRDTLVVTEGLRDYYRQSLMIAKRNKPNEEKMLKAIEALVARPLWLSKFLRIYRKKLKHFIRNFINISKKLRRAMV